ncbi:MAG: hypothetical protein P1U68_11520 [Verrucomicrobiales bacterium]|nr:hypothetical protein [Verrucomicrobiales bacterium]
MKWDHEGGIEICPFLPVVAEPLRAASMKQCGRERGECFYLLALQCAQSLWRQGLPAQAMLLLNRAFSADLKGDEAVLTDWPLPYAAMAWIMKNRRDHDFVGNPRRHFQHLATRMVEPRRELRSWRAWACWWYACQIFPDFPADEKQLKEEAVKEPTLDEIAFNLGRVGVSGEVEWWRSVRI